MICQECKDTGYVSYEVEEIKECPVCKAEEINCSHCNDTQEYEGDTCPYCKQSKEEREGEQAFERNRGN